MKRFEEIEARLRAATPGPWSCESDWSNVFSIAPGYIGRFVAGVILRPTMKNKLPESTPDAILIAETPTDLRYLLDFAKAAKEALEKASKGYYSLVDLGALPHSDWDTIAIEHKAQCDKALALLEGGTK